MREYLIHGGRRLSGRITAQGAKNSVLPILAATVLTGGKCLIRHCPRLTDVDAAVAILENLGCRATRDDDLIEVDSTTVTGTSVPEKLMGEMRSSVFFLGAILGRTGVAEMSQPGGCELGLRPIDMHLDALRTLGIVVDENGGKLKCRVSHLRGGRINLPFPSVGATENAILAAVTAEGETIITNAACEPEIVDLAHFLILSGANITGAGTGKIRIVGAKLHGCEYTVMPDRMATATYLCAVASTGGMIEIDHCRTDDLTAVLAALEHSGCDIRCGEDFIRLNAPERLVAVDNIRTLPYPGFPTDAQAPLMAALATAKGTTLFVETIFENRFRHVAELVRMGADIRTEGRVAIVRGVQRLHGANLNTTDLRGGAALVIAALGTDDFSRIRDRGHIDRGYENFEGVLSSLGAEIERNDY